MQSRENDREIWYLHIKSIFFTDVLSSGRSKRMCETQWITRQQKRPSNPGNTTELSVVLHTIIKAAQKVCNESNIQGMITTILSKLCRPLES